MTVRNGRGVPRRRLRARWLMLAPLLVLVAACDEDGGDDLVVVPGPTPAARTTAAAGTTPTPAPTPTPPGPITVDMNFQQGIGTWKAVFADYPAADASYYYLRSGYHAVPPTLTDRSGFMLSSVNRSDDVFMGVYSVVEHLAPNTGYRIDSTITLAANAPTGCSGVGGAPGENVYVKAGASDVVPEPTTTGQVTIPVDKANQGSSGTDMVVIGDLATPENTDCLPVAPFHQKTVQTSGNAPTVTSDASGRLWLIAGTDSGYESLTTWYVLSVRFTLTPA